MSRLNRKRLLIFWIAATAAVTFIRAGSADDRPREIASVGASDPQSTVLLMSRRQRRSTQERFCS